MKAEAIPSVITAPEAMDLSRRMAAPDMFQEAKQAFARSLFDYYKALLSHTVRPTIPTPRRWL